MHGLTAADVPILVAGMLGTAVYGPTLVATFGGLRRGEILGLSWKSVNLESGVISVYQTLEERKDRSLRLKLPKTKNSIRTVVLPPFVVAELRRHRAEVEEHFGRDRVPELVFSDWETGKHWSPDALSSQFYYLVRARALPRVSFHGLRHTYSNLMQAVGVPLLVTSRAWACRRLDYRERLHRRNGTRAFRCRQAATGPIRLGSDRCSGRSRASGVRLIRWHPWPANRFTRYDRLVVRAGRSSLALPHPKSETGAARDLPALARGRTDGRRRSRLADYLRDRKIVSLLSEV